MSQKTTKTPEKARHAWKYEYRLTWKRVGGIFKRKRYKLLPAARRRMVLMGPEPWLAYARNGRGPDDFECCSGCECGCGGKTVRQRAILEREDLPALEWMRLERRHVTVTPWEEFPA